MTIPRMAKAVGYLDGNLIAEAEERRRIDKSHPWILWGAVAACLVAVTVIGTTLWPTFTNTRENGRYKEHSLTISSTAIIWPWEYRSVSEQYTRLDMHGAAYYGKGQVVPEASLEERLGSFTVSGYDEYAEESHTMEAEVFRLQGVTPTQYVAVRLTNRCYVFKNEAYLPPGTLGELLKDVDLPALVELERFSENGDSPDHPWYRLSDDQYIWEELTACADARLVEDPSWVVVDRQYISFGITSEALGAYKRALYITEDGYLWTNAFDWQYLFAIGPEAAGRILHYARENASPAEYEPYMPTIAGTITEIADGYIVVDDSVLCSNPQDGITYRILLEDIRMSRYFDRQMFQVGDVVQVSYMGTIGAQDHTIATGVSIEKAFINEE